MRRNVLSWLAVVLGFLLGILALARFGMAWPPFGDNDPGWLLRWISYVGGALLGARIHCGFHRRVTESETSGTRLAHHHSIRCFLSRVSVCGISGVAFRRRRLVRAPRDSNRHWVDSSVLRADLRGPAGTAPQKLDLLSFCRHSRLDGGCVRPIPLVKGVFATFCRMVSDISVVWIVLARNR